MKTIQSTVSTPDELYPFHQPLEQITFFDIETTGLSPKTSSIYLIGVMHYDSHKQSWQITQWFADDYQSEEPILEAFLSYLEDFSYLYHFNGCTFDIPFVKAKCQKHHIAIPETVQPLLSETISSQVNDAGANIDLLKEIRPLKKLLGLAKANQTYLEHWIGLNREDTYDGGQLIKVYSEYMQQKIMKKPGADELEHLLLLHNHDDIAGMLSVCIMLSYKDLFHPVRPFSSCSCTAENGRIHISFPVRLPRESTLYHAFEKSDSSECIFTEPACLSLQKNLATLSLPLYRGVLKFFIRITTICRRRTRRSTKALLSLSMHPAAGKQRLPTAIPKKRAFSCHRLPQRKAALTNHAFTWHTKHLLSAICCPQMTRTSKEKCYPPTFSMSFLSFDILEFCR